MGLFSFTPYVRQSWPSCWRDHKCITCSTSKSCAKLAPRSSRLSLNLGWHHSISTVTTVHLEDVWKKVKQLVEMSRPPSRNVSRCEDGADASNSMSLCRVWSIICAWCCEVYDACSVKPCFFDRTGWRNKYQLALNAEKSEVHLMQPSCLCSSAPL